MISANRPNGHTEVTSIEFNQTIDAAGLGEGWTPNMLRHSAASLMSDAGIPLERIADQLGHKDTRMLANHYRHQVRPTIDAALILDQVLNRPNN